jgi:enterochelin esterase-like enzyme
MGGGQSLNFGLGHLDIFAWVGGLSSAPNTRTPKELVVDVAAAKQLKLLWLSCGNKDGLIRISQGVHAYLKENGVPHVWHVTDHAHDAPEWKQTLYHFEQQLFKRRAHEKYSVGVRQLQLRSPTKFGGSLHARECYPAARID